MSRLQLLGLFLIMIPLVGMFAQMVKDMGWKESLIAFAAAIAMTVCITVGVILLVKT